jgi:bacillithiol synthase
MAPRSPDVVDYGAFPDPPSLLFRDYIAGTPRLLPFYGNDGWDLAAVGRAAERSRTLERSRVTLAERLAEEQQGRGASRAAAAAHRLADPRAVAVITGQQAGLFGGPLLVLLKALATLRLARDLEAATGAPVVPLFWVAADDHDFAEIRETTVSDSSAAQHTLRYNPTVEPVGQPAARIVLDETITTLVDELATSLAGAPFRDELLARVRAAYAPGVPMAEAFARLLSSLLPDLVVLDGSATWLKTLAIPLMERELRECSETSRLAREAGKRLLAAGYHEQVLVRPGFLNLCLYAEGQRRALATNFGAIEIRGTERRLTLDEALASLSTAPADWSAGALLRPLVQDFVLPTAAYVGGPAEIAYHAQIGPSYAHLGIPRPVLLPRPGLTLVEPREARTLEAEGLAFVALTGDLETILAGWARDSHPEIEAAFERTREVVRREMAAVEDALGGLDPSLKAAANSTVGRMLHPLEGLAEKALRAQKRREVERAERLRRAREVLFPGGHLQERTLGLVAPLARHGEGLIDVLRESLDVWARGHQVLAL